MTTKKPKTRPYKKFFCDRPEAFLLPPIAFKIWMYHYSREGASRESWPSVATILKACDIPHTRTLYRWRAYLIKNGWLDLVRRIPSRKGGQPVPVFKVRRGSIPTPCKGVDSVTLITAKGVDSVRLQGDKNSTPKGVDSVTRSRYIEVDTKEVDTHKPEVDGIRLSIPSDSTVPKGLPAGARIGRAR